MDVSNASNMTDFASELDHLRQTVRELENKSATQEVNQDTFFIIVMACLIFFMQCGFAFLEAGSVRSKNTTNILLKNLLDVCFGAIFYWGIGFAFAFGPGNLFIGYRHFFFESMPPSLYHIFFFHFVFAATSATIVSGAMAERTEFVSYMSYSGVLTGFIYPVVSHWAWSSEGWLGTGIDIGDGETIGYMDFAGSGVVHMVGGTAALVGAAMVGPRIGRFDKDGKALMIQGHTVPLVALGGFILFFGFFAFNGGSQASISQEGDGVVVALAIINTVISGGFAAIVALAMRKIGVFGGENWSLLTTINGALTGMVAICAGCNVVAPWGAAIIGAIAGLTYMLWSVFMTKIHVDDPLDSVAVHLGGGIWGVLAAPLLAHGDGVVFLWSRKAFAVFGWNALGACAIFLWTAITSLALFGSLRLAKVLRVSPEIERKGIDIAEHGEPAYPIASYGSGWPNDLNNLLDTPPKSKQEGSPVSSESGNGHINGHMISSANNSFVLDEDNRSSGTGRNHDNGTDVEIGLPL